MSAGHRALRAFVFKRDGGKCLCCGSRKRLTLDHIIPEALGGPTLAWNLQLLCYDCNQRKDNTIRAYRTEPALEEQLRVYEAALLHGTRNQGGRREFNPSLVEQAREHCERVIRLNREMGS